MMVADANLQVWLDAQANTTQILMVPYIRSVKDLQISYRMDVVQRGDGGISRISQQGKVSAPATQAVPLGRVAIGSQRHGECSIELVLRENDAELGVYRFDCPR